MIKRWMITFVVLVGVSACRPAVDPAPSLETIVTEAPGAAPAPVEEVEAESSATALAAEGATAPPVDAPAPTEIVCDGVRTPPQQEGPYYSPGSPERTTLIEEGMAGTPVLLFGRVFNQDCEPLAGVKVDFWLADVDGEYDNVGYRLRGHVFTDETGYYELESIEPGLYTGRPPHIHVKLFAPDGRELLTTQMYFAGSENSAEVTGSPELYVSYGQPDAAGRTPILFNFVVPN